MADDATLTLGTLFRADVSSLTQAIGQIRTAISGLNKDLGQGVRTAAGQSTKAIKGLAVATGDTEGPTKKAGRAYDGFSKQISRVSGPLERVKAALKVTASYGLAATAIYSVVSAMKAGVSEIIDYDQALKNLQAITGATNAQVAAMGDVIKNVARTTKFSTAEVASGMVLLGQAGFDAGEAMDAMQATANLATGTLADMQLVTDLLTTTIRAFNLSTIESGRVADVMANAINKSKLTIDKLRISFNYVGAVAAQAGLSLEETAASMMNLANNGLRASTIGTGLRQVLSRLISPNEKLREAYEEHGIAVDKITPKAGKFQEALKYLSTVLVEADGKTIDMAKAFQLFGLRGAQAAAIIVRSFISGDFQSALSKVYEVGVAEAMAAKQGEGLAVSLKNLGDRAKLIAVQFGEAGLTGVMAALIDVLKSLATTIETLVSTAIGELTIKIAAWTATIYYAGRAVVFLSGQLDKLVLIFLRFGKALFTNPWLAAAAAIGILVSVIRDYLADADKLIDTLSVQNVKLNQAIESLKLYQKAIAEVAKRRDEGNDIDNEYISMLQRIVSMHPELTDEIQLTTDAWEANNAAIANLLDKRYEEELGNLIDQVKAYSEAAEDAAIKSGIWAWVKEQAGGVTDILKETVGLNTELGKVGVEKLGEGYEKARTNVKAFIGELIKGLKAEGEGSEEATKRLKEKDDALRKIAERYVELAKEASLEVAMQEILFTLGLTEEEAWKVIDALEEMLVVGGTGVDILAKAVRDKLPKEFKDLYKTLDSYGRLTFAKAIKQMDSQIAAHKKAMEMLIKAGLATPKQLAEDIGRIHKEVFRGLVKDISDVTNEYKKLVNELKAGESEIRKLEIAQQEMLKSRDYTETEKLNIIKSYAIKIAKILTDLWDKEKALEIDRLEVQGKKFESYTKEIEQLEAKRNTLLELANWGADLGPDELLNLYNQIAEITNQIMDVTRKGNKEAFAELLDITRKYSKEYTEIMKGMRKDDLIDEAVYRKYLEDMAKYTADRAEELYRRRLISGKEYYEALQQLERFRLITAEELRDKEIELTKGLYENWELGLRQAGRALERWTDIVRNFGRDVSDKFASGLTTALWNIADKSQEAGDAFRDFAMSFLRWIGEIVTKRLILSALEAAGLIKKEEESVVNMGLVASYAALLAALQLETTQLDLNTASWLRNNAAKIGGIFGGVGGSGGGGMFDIPVFHEGGVVGKTPAPTRVVNPLAFMNAPRLHGGLKANERPGIFEEGETIIPKGKSAADHATFHININAVDARSFAELARKNPGAIVGPFLEAWKRGGMLRNTVKATI